MGRDPQSRTLEICVQRIQAGEDLEEVLGSYPRWSGTFRPILQAVQAAMYYAESIQLPENILEESRMIFLETASGNTAYLPTQNRKNVFKVGIFLIIALLLLSVSLWQLVRVSSENLPGDFLYPVKQLCEQLRLITASISNGRLSLEYAYDQERIQEVENLLSKGKSQEVKFSGRLERMEIEEWLVGDIRVLIPDNTRIIGEIQSGFFVSVDGITRSEGVVVANEVKMREYSFEGIIEEHRGDKWIIENVEVITSSEIYLHGEPNVGSYVLVIAWRTADGELVARLIEVVDR